MRLRTQVIAPVHDQQGSGVVAEERSQLVLVGSHAPEQGRRVGGQMGAVGVTDGQVLGSNGAAIGCLPPEGGPVHPFRDTPPHHGMRQTGQAEKLGHLAGVTEHVGQVTHRHRPAKSLGPAQPQLQIADERLGGDAKLVHQDIPGADLQAALLGQPADAARGFGSDLQKIVDHGHLAVEEKTPERRIALQHDQQFVEHLHQADPEVFVRGVPLAVPVGVGNDAYPTGHIGVRVRSGVDWRATFSATRVQHRLTSRSLPASAGGHRSRVTRSGPARKGGIACGDRRPEKEP